MKYLSIFFILMSLSVQQVFGQQNQAGSNELLSKNGHHILPEAGDWSIGFDAIPLINFGLNAVNIMDDTGDSAQNPGYVAGFEQVITGKYFINEQTAYRLKLGIGLEADNTSTWFNDPLDTSADPDQLENVFKVRSTDIFLSGGIEKRSGETRVQGFYGAEGVANFSSGRNITDYGLEWTTQAENAGLVNNGQQRLLREVDGKTFGIGGRGFIGVEYFFAPKMSISAEYGIGLIFLTRGRSSVVYEVYQNGSTSEVETSGTSSGRTFQTAVDNANASLSLLFHF